MKIGLLLIATGQYKSFVQNLLEGVKKFLLVDHDIDVYLFTDDIDPVYNGNERVNIRKHLIPSYKFPMATLMRYHVFTTGMKYDDCDYLFYLDIDSAIVDYVGDEVLGNIVAVRHPGFYAKNGGSWETNMQSTAFTFENNRSFYYAGGFQGGNTDIFYHIMLQLRRNIDEDERNGVRAVHNDESHWNKYISECKYFKELTPDYMMVEQQNLREAWRISYFSPKIIALAKNHEEIRK